MFSFTMNNNWTCLRSNHSPLADARSNGVRASCSRVIPSPSIHQIDLPELESIQMGFEALKFKSGDASNTLILRGSQSRQYLLNRPSQSHFPHKCD